MNPSWIYCHPR